MRCERRETSWRLLGLALLMLAALPSRAAADDVAQRRQAMIARIDELLTRQWAEVEIEPVGPASDAEFLRRAHLDLTGIIPTVTEVRNFLHPDADSPIAKANDKRAWLIDYLLSRPNHATHLAHTWRRVMLPADANTNQFVNNFQFGFENWLRGKFVDNVPYDAMVRELITSSGNVQQNGAVLFYTALKNKPEDLASSTSKIFLGVQIGCAQCHNHPFDHWTQQDFWGYAAFFAQIQQPAQQNAQFVQQVADTNQGEVKLPGSEEVVSPCFLGGQQAEVIPTVTRRQMLANWITSADNPYFARATVNRAWAHMFGRGLVDPVDDLGQHNTPSHPELLNELAQYFVATGFDLQELFRTLANTRAYQLSSEVPVAGEPDEALFSRMTIKSLHAEQIYDCLKEAMRQRQAVNVNQFGRVFDQNRALFLSRFDAPTQKATEFQAGIPQALTLMNGAMIAQATNLENSDVLNALEAPFFRNDGERIEVLFLSTLSRYPNDQERANFAAYVNKGGAAGNRRKALGDVLWALLNSAEFILNH